MKKKPGKFILVIIIAFVVSAINYLCYPLISDLQREMVTVGVVNGELKEYSIIEETDIRYIKIEKNNIPQNVITDSSAIIGMMVKDGFTLTDGMYFYKDSICKKEDITSPAAANIETGKYLLTLKLDRITSTDNSLRPGQFIDVYYIGNDSRLKTSIITGMIVKKAQIQQVSDDGGYLYCTISLSEEQLDYCLRASEIGRLQPFISSNSFDNEVVDEQYYSLTRIKAYIDENSLAFRKSNLNASTE